MARLRIMLAAVALLPLFAFAADGIPAGFAPGTLWLSKTTATAGDTLKIFTVVYDSAAADIEGDVVFSVDAQEAGTQHFSLASGETKIVSLDWVAVAGAHTFSAVLKNISGVSDGISHTETNAADITVAQAPPSPVALYTNIVTGAIASSSPAVRSVVQTVVGTTEGLRRAGVDWLNQALYTDQAVAPDASFRSDPEVLGASTSAGTASPAPKSDLFASFRHTLLTALLFVFTVKMLFYAALLAVVYIIYKVIRAIFSTRRP